MASPVKKLRPGPEAGAEVSAKQEGDTWTGRVQKLSPRRSPAPGSCLSCSHTHCTLYLASPSLLGTANRHTQGTSTQPQQPQCSRGAPAGEDSSALSLVFPDQAGKPEYLFRPSPKPEDAGFRCSSSLGVRPKSFAHLMTLCPRYGSEQLCHQRPACLLFHLSQQIGIAGNFCVRDPEAASGEGCAHPQAVNSSVME